jgi:hypothetical protein
VAQRHEVHNVAVVATQNSISEVADCTAEDEPISDGKPASLGAPRQRSHAGDEDHEHRDEPFPRAGEQAECGPGVELECQPERAEEMDPVVEVRDGPRLGRLVGSDHDACDTGGDEQRPAPSAV